MMEEFRDLTIGSVQEREKVEYANSREQMPVDLPQQRPFIDLG